MSVGGNSGMGSVAEEYSDLEHQVIRQSINLLPAQQTQTLGPGDNGAEFDPGERELDREEVAQLVAYRRHATMVVDLRESDILIDEDRVSIDASVGINGDLFREVTTQQSVNDFVDVDSGGEIGLLDHYELNVIPMKLDDASSTGAAGDTTAQSEHTIDFYDWPTGGPVVDSFDTITCGFGAGSNAESSEGFIELRYDFWWDVVETGETTSPFGRP